MISNLNAPNDRPTDVYPFNVTPAPVHPTSYTLTGEGWTLHPPTPPDGDDYTYDLRPAPEREQSQIADLEARVKQLEIDNKILKTDMGIVSISLLEMVSRIEALEYNR